MALIDAYTSANSSVVKATYDGGVKVYGQSFQCNVKSTLASASFYIARSASSEAANVVAQLWSTNPATALGAAPMSSLLATSNNVSYAGLATSPAWVEFTFSGANAVAMTRGLNYVVAISYTDSDASNYVNVYADSAGTHAGIASRTYTTGGSGEAIIIIKETIAGVDLLFKVNATVNNAPMVQFFSQR